MKLNTADFKNSHQNVFDASFKNNYVLRHSSFDRFFQICIWRKTADSSAFIQAQTKAKDWWETYGNFEWTIRKETSEITAKGFINKLKVGMRQVQT